MSPEIVEAVARAIYQHHFPRGRWSYSEHVDCGAQNCEHARCINDAYAALNAAEPLIRQQARAQAFEEAIAQIEATDSDDWWSSGPDHARAKKARLVERIRALAKPAQPTAQGGEK